MTSRSSLLIPHLIVFMCIISCMSFTAKAEIIWQFDTKSNPQHISTEALIKTPETEQALEKLDEILDTENLDGIYIGPADLSLAVGEEPGFDRPESTTAYKQILRILEAAKKRNLLAGIHNGSAEYAQKMISRGFNLVTVGSDQRFMSSGAKATIEKIKGKKSKEDSKGY